MGGVRVYAGPLRYLQGPGALDMLGSVLATYGPRPVLVTDAFVRDLLGERIDAILAASGLTPVVRLLTGEITPAVADDIAASVRDVDAGVVVGVGGGKSLDAAKAVSLRLGVPVVTVPTNQRLPAAPRQPLTG